ncbi:MAG: SdiA-regulated domain-containing protein [Endozoicomonas sp.]
MMTHLLLVEDNTELAGSLADYLSEVGFEVDFALEAGFNGLTDNIPQAEGVTLDADRNLYIVSEPNLIYRFSQSVRVITVQTVVIFAAANPRSV